MSEWDRFIEMVPPQVADDDDALSAWLNDHSRDHLVVHGVYAWLQEVAGGSQDGMDVLALDLLVTNEHGDPHALHLSMSLRCSAHLAVGMLKALAYSGLSAEEIGCGDPLCPDCP